MPAWTCPKLPEGWQDLQVRRAWHINLLFINKAQPTKPGNVLKQTKSHIREGQKLTVKTPLNQPAAADELSFHSSPLEHSHRRKFLLVHIGFSVKHSGKSAMDTGKERPLSHSKDLSLGCAALWLPQQLDTREAFLPRDGSENGIRLSLSRFVLEEFTGNCLLLHGIWLISASLRIQ